jgi:hypothetical protein
MGDLVIKKAYLLARQDTAYALLAKRIHTIYFLATPDPGSVSAKVLRKKKVVFNCQNKIEWRKYLPHICCVLVSNEAGKTGETRIALSRRFGSCLLSDGRYNEAETPFVGVMETRKGC